MQVVMMPISISHWLEAMISTKLTPKYHDRTQPGRWRKFSDYYVARYLEQYVRNEKDKKSNVVVLPFHLEVFLQSLQPSISDVDSINKSQGIEQGNGRQYVDIAFPDELLLGGAVDGFRAGR